MSRTFPISCKSENRLGAFRLLSYQYKVKYKEKVYTFHFEPGITFPIRDFEVNTIIVLLEILELEMINFLLSAWKGNLNNYFNFYVCLSFLCPCIRACFRKLALIPAVESQNVTNKSWLVRVKNMHPKSPSDLSGTATAEVYTRF